MSAELKIQYKLYALEVNKAGIETASNERFCRITPFYILVYSCADEAPAGAIEITQTETHRLSKQDEQWLLDCNIVILTEEAKKHETEIAKDMSARIDAMEKYLAENRQEG